MIWQEPVLLQQAVQAVAKVISWEFSIAVAAGGLCLTCGLLMTSEKLEYTNARSEKDDDRIMGGHSIVERSCHS